MESVNFLNGSDPDMCAMRLVAKTAKATKAMMSMVKIQKLPLRFEVPLKTCRYEVLCTIPLLIPLIYLIAGILSGISDKWVLPR